MSSPRIASIGALLVLFVGPVRAELTRSAGLAPGPSPSMTVLSAQIAPPYDYKKAGPAREQPPTPMEPRPR